MNGFSSVGIDIQSLIIYLVNFGILYFVVSKFLVGPVLKVLQKRTDIIEKNLNEAEKLKTEMAKEKQEFLQFQQQMRTKMDFEMKEFEKSIKDSLKKSEKDIEDKKAQMMEQAQKEISSAKKDIYNQVKGDLLLAIQQLTSKATDLNKVNLQDSIDKVLDRK